MELVGRDVYKLLLQYVMRALREQFNLSQPLRKWPTVSGPLLPGEHPTMKQLARHAIISMQRFYEFFNHCRLRMGKFRIFVCLCGKRFATDKTLFRESEEVAGMPEPLYQQLYLFQYVACVVCLDCWKYCKCRYKTKILKTMKCCFDCDETDDEAIEQWEKLQLKPF